jgi:hypothetical protein
MYLNETYSKVGIVKYLPDTAPVQNMTHPPKRRCFIAFEFYLCFRIWYMIKNAQENQLGLILIGGHQFLVSTDDLKLLWDNINTIKNTEYVTLVRTSN